MAKKSTPFGAIAKKLSGSAQKGNGAAPQMPPQGMGMPQMGMEGMCPACGQPLPQPGMGAGIQQLPPMPPGMFPPQS